jgi:hypothetical protein
MRKNAKQVVYRYNGVAASDEVEVDLDGDLSIPEQGQLVNRNGKLWKCAGSITELSSTGAIPVVRVFLGDSL